MKITKKSAFLAAFIGIMLLGSFLRLYKLGEVSFTADEFLGVNATYGYLKTGEWKRWDFNSGSVADDKPYAHTVFDLSSSDAAEDGQYTRAWMYNWQVAQTLKFLSYKTESSFRVISALWGILGIVAIYYVAKYFTGEVFVGLISAFLYAVNMSAIIFDRKLRMYAMFFVVYLIFSYLLYKFLESKKFSKNIFIQKMMSLTGLNWAYFLPVVILGLVSFHLHLLAANIVFVAIIYFIVNSVAISRKSTISNRYSAFLAILAAIFIAGLIFLPKLVMPFLNGFRPENHYSYIIKVLEDYNNWMLAIALIFFGAYFMIKKDFKKGIFVAASFFVPLFLAIFFWNRNAGDQYIFFIKSFEIILIASGVYFIINFFKDSMQGKKKVLLVALIAFAMLVPNYGYFFQDNNTYHKNSNSEDPNYRKVFGYFLKNKKEGDVLVTRWFRNYYFSGSNVDVVTFGGERSSKEERKITAERLMSIQNEHLCGWFIWSESDDDYITADAKEYARKNFDQINAIAVRGNITVNRWCNE